MKRRAQVLRGLGFLAEGSLPRARDPRHKASGEGLSYSA